MSILDITSTKTTLKKVSSTRGGEYAGPCPGCGGSDRFRVWPADKGGEGSWWCRGCGKGGDNVQFLVEFCGMAYRDAFKAVGRDTPAGYQSAKFRAMGSAAGANLTPAQAFSPRHYDPPVETWQLKAEKLISESHENLIKNEKVLGWLAARGLDLDAVKAFRLGWFPGENDKACMWRPRTSWGLPEIKKDNGRPKMLWIPRGIIIPWYHDGQIMRIKIRRPGRDLRSQNDVKYYFMPGSSAEPALLNSDRKAYVIVESELDGLLVARKAGAMVGCLVLGSAGNKPGALAYARLKKSIRILDALDCDQAGVSAGKWWKEIFPQVVRWPVPVGKDPGEAFAGGVDILEWILAGLPPALTMKLKETAVEKTNDQVETPPPADQKKTEPLSPAATTDSSTKPVVPPAPAEPLPLDGPPSTVWTDEMIENAMVGTHDSAAPMEYQETMVSSPSFPANCPTNIAELRDLLNKYPVKIIATDMRTAIVTTPEWKNTDVTARVSHLVYTDIDVLQFLEAHPHNTIHRGNFNLGLKQEVCR